LDIATYRKNREEIDAQKVQYRSLCTDCMQPSFSCYCAHIQKFNPQIKFVILIHPIEMRRRIATGRMSHLTLENSELIMGLDYSNDGRVNELLSNQNLNCVLLYPGKNSKDVSKLGENEKSLMFENQRTLTVFVIDGTWATARKMVRLSQNILNLPRICFTPDTPSRFRVRKQPAPECYSTIEAIHHTIEILGKRAGFNSEGREHDKLLHVFDKMVERQLEFIRDAYDNPHSTSYRRPKSRVTG